MLSKVAGEFQQLLIKGLQHQMSDTANTTHQTSAAPLNAMRQFTFHFKKQKTLDAEGEMIKRPSVILDVPVPTYDGLIVAIGNDSKVSTFLLDLIEEAIKDQVRDMLVDSDKPVQRQEDLDVKKLTLEYIANIPKSERAGGNIPKETWEAFEKDYIEVMYTEARPKASINAAKVFLAKLAPARTDKVSLALLQSRLAEWLTRSSNTDDFMDIYKYLDDRISMLLAKEIDLASQL
jgi:hypothetical protein